MGTAAIDLTGSQWQNTDSFNVTLDNRVEATTASGASKAFIDKKFAGLWITADGDATDTVGITDPGQVTDPREVPLPSAAWLLGSGLIGVVGIARRRMHSA